MLTNWSGVLCVIRRNLSGKFSVWRVVTLTVAPMDFFADKVNSIVNGIAAPSACHTRIKWLLPVDNMFTVIYAWQMWCSKYVVSDSADLSLCAAVCRATGTDWCRSL